MSTARRYHHTYADYLRLEGESPLKLEYFDGEIFAMAGATPEHGALAMQFVRLTSASLPPTCTVLSSHVKLRVAASDLATYPDVSIVCGPLAHATDDSNAIVNPRFIVEVTSPSTEDYDRGDKLSQYKQLPSLEAVILISHRAKRWRYGVEVIQIEADDVGNVGRWRRFAREAVAQSRRSDDRAP